MELKIDFLESYDRESLIAELRRIAKVTGKRTLTRDMINKYGRVNALTVATRFGSLHEAHKAAGLVPGVLRKTTDQDLLKIVVDVWTLTQKKFGRSPAMHEVQKYGFPITGQSIAKRFGTWTKALIAAAKMASNQTGSKNEKAEKPQVKPARKRVRFSERKRFLVFRRDGYTCRMCKRKGGELHVDHVIPFCRGGSDKIDNLQTLCRDCNVGKRGNLE